MTFYTLHIPPNFELLPALNFVKEAAAVPAESAIVSLDFSSWAKSRSQDLPLKPFGMLIVSQAVCQLKARLPKMVLVPLNLPANDVEDYATHMGFFEACGVDLKKPYGQAKGSPTYLPMTKRNTSDVLHGRDAEAMGLELAKRLTQQSDGGLVKTLAYSFMEIIRNVIEHSRSREFWYCAQYWKSRGEAEIALLDSGVGLHASLQNNPHLRPIITDEKAALKYALWPGVSGQMWAGKRVDHNDPWQNSGYGLYMNYRICNEGGSFFIGSGATGLYREKDADNQYTAYGLPGVALRLRVKVDTLEKYDTHYHRVFLQDAAREAEKIQGGVLPTGDTMSQMLRQNFESPQIGVGSQVRHPKMGIATVEQVQVSKQGTLMLTIRLADQRVKQVRADEVERL